MNRGLIAGIGAAVVFAALIAFVAGGSGTGVGDPDTPYGVVTVDGQLPPYSSSSADAALGLPMPVIEGTALDGSALTLAATGEPQAIVFLAHWCPHCQAEVPEIQGWLEATGGVEGADVVAVATAINPRQPNYSPHEWLDREGWSPATLWDDEASSVLNAFGGGSFPFWVFVDGDGVVQGRLAGGIGAESLEQVLVTLAG